MADDQSALYIPGDQALLFEDEVGQLTLLIPPRPRVPCHRCGLDRCRCLPEGQTCSSCLQWPRCETIAFLDGVRLDPMGSACAWTPPLYLPAVPHQT